MNVLTLRKKPHPVVWLKDLTLLDVASLGEIKAISLDEEMWESEKLGASSGLTDAT